MELPFALHFLRKVELFQVLKKLDKQFLLQLKEGGPTASPWEGEKKILFDGSATEKEESYATLEHLLSESLKMLHPFMPFITEEIYQKFHPEKLLMIEKW